MTQTKPSGKVRQRQGDVSTVIWVNEHIDPCGLIYSCIACCNEQQARECHETFKQRLTLEQQQAGWIAQLRTVEAWDDVPVSALKLS